VVAALAVGLGLAAGPVGLPSPAAPASSAPSAPASRTVVLYGDSLADQASPYFVKAVEQSPEVTARVAAWDGTAPCDWLPAMAEAARSRSVSVAVLDFSGNSITPCMRGAPYRSARYYQKYFDDVTTAAEAFVRDGTKVVLVGAPQSLKQYLHGGTGWNRLNRILAGIAAAHPDGVSYDDAGRAVMVDGHYTWAMPCRSDEQCDDEPVRGENIVRAPDGFHFCPTGQTAVHGYVPPCAAYMSGAFRYGLDMADAALRALGRPAAAG
jgi:hypothetical protein